MKHSRRFTAVAAATAVTLAGLGALAPSPTAAAAPAADLMISVYIEGSSNNKALELYNPTTADLDLSGYSLELYVNGQTTTQSTLSLSGTITSDGHYLITHNQWALEVTGDISHAVTNYNGDDTIVLRKGAAVLDSIGQLGFDPGTNWTVGEGDAAVATSEMTLTKKACTVDDDPSDVYDPSVDFAATAQNDVSTLATFSCTPLVAPPAEPEPSPTPEPGELRIGDVQGTTDTSPYAGQTVIVDGYVTATFQGTETGRVQLDGFYVQDAGDDNPSTSDGLFVYSPGGAARTVGEKVRVTGTVAEAFGQTQLNPTSVEVLPADDVMIEAAELTVPVTDFERYEGMYVTFPQDLAILEYFNFDRFGEIVYGPERQWTPTGVAAPGAPAQVIAAQNAANRVIVDDGFNSQNISPAIHPNGRPFAQDNYFRGGDLVSGLTGIMSYRNNVYKLQQTQGGTYTAVNERPAVPAVGGDFTVTSFNVLNYFTTLNMRGATTTVELERQQAKIVAALAEIDADVVGLMEIQNNAPTAVQHLVDGLNAEVGAGTYAAVDTGVQGTDEIFQAIIYKTATTEPVGDFAVLDFDDGLNRPSLTQTFRHTASGELVTLNVNHLKSKGSACTDDPDLGDGAGNCNLTRVAAAQAIADWLATDPTGQGSTRTIVMGDLNSYDHEEPISVFLDAGYTDLEKQFNGDEAYSYVFDGQLGYLDYGLANAAALADVVGASSWHINSDESDLFDYTVGFKQPNEAALFSPDPYRSSDHDPVIIGLQLGETVEPSPTPTPTPEPSPTATVTVTASPTPGRDLYDTPGFHTSAGRQWMTVCEDYSSSVHRCWTWIWGTTVHGSGGQYVQVNGWNFNNLTYVGGTRAEWAANPLGYTGRWTSDAGRTWSTVCDTPVSGGNGCRSYVTASVIERVGARYRVVTKEVFNNQVRFS